MFDELLEESLYGKADGDPNPYHLGVREGHNVVLAYIEMGTKSASSASFFKSSFRFIRLGLVVGICGVPDIEDRNGITEVLLDDVIISTRLVECRSGKQYLDKFEEKDPLQQATEEIRKHTRKLEGDYQYKKLQGKSSTYLSDAVQRPNGGKWRYPASNRDTRFVKMHPGFLAKNSNVTKRFVKFD